MHTCRCQLLCVLCNKSDQWRVSPPQCGELKKLELDRHLRPCVGKSFSCWCCSVKASKNPIVTRNHVACSSFQQEWAGDWTNLAMLEDRAFLDPSSMSCQCCQCRHAHAGVSQRRLRENQFSLLQTARSMKSVSFTMLKTEKAWVWQTPQTLCWEEFLVADAALLKLPRILSSPGITLPVPVPSKNEQGIEQIWPCWKSKHLP